MSHLTLNLRARFTDTGRILMQKGKHGLRCDSETFCFVETVFTTIFMKFDG